MKKFILKVTIFILPLIFLQVYTFIYYKTQNGDLLRIGYIAYNFDYRYIFKKEFERDIQFDNISDLNLSSNHAYKIFTIGDSFSEQKNTGYQNYLAVYNDVKIVHFDNYLNNNSIQTLHGLLNGGLFNKIDVDYIILQSIERNFVNWSKQIDSHKIIPVDSLIYDIKHHKFNINKESLSDKLFTDRVFKFPLYNVLYYLDDNAFFSQTYRVNTNENLFSVKNNELLFYYKDLNNIKINNDFEAVLNLNNELNVLTKKLMQKGIKLIVLPSPDKYNFYYDKIANNKKYPKPLFFEHLEKMSKDYIYINAKQILKDEMECMKDIYFYDDSHWSPVGSKLIAKEIGKILK